MTYMKLFASNGSHTPDPIQRFSMLMMSLLVLLTFVGTNMQALLWQSSDWLVSTVLPAVVIDLTNDERNDNSVPQLVRNTVLDQAAQAKARHMAENEYFAHFAPDGTTPWKFFQDEGYGYAHAGENLAIHFTDSAEVVEAWMLSPTHKKNIVDHKFTEIGVGTARGEFDGYDTVYVVQLFGTPAVPAATPAPLAVVSESTPVAPIQTPEIVVKSEVVPVESVLVTEIEPDSKQETAPTAVLSVEDVESEIIEIEIEPVVVITQETEIALEPIPELKTSVIDDVVVVETALATSSGLAVATMIDAPTVHAGATIASIATRPNLMLQILYTTVAGLIVISLTYALAIEARRLHYVQVAYSIALLFVMGGLWFLHTTLTNGAVIA